jgi:quinol monooxygenase YgiN
MHSTRRQNFLSMLIVLAWLFLLSSCNIAQHNNQLVRLAIIDVDSSQLNRYNEFLKEEIEASIKVEPGVITLFGVADKENPEHVTLFETYADSAQYKTHLTTPHFQKYKKGTLDMVKHLQLIVTNPIIYVRKKELDNLNPAHLFIRLIKMEIDSAEIENFNRLASSVMLPGIQKEKGVLVMYAVAEKLHPSKISVLEVYADAAAYEAHIKTEHFITYKNNSKSMVTSLNLINVEPILLGSKAQVNFSQ